METKNTYKPKHSCIAFLLAVMLPSVTTYLWQMICIGLGLIKLTNNEGVMSLEYVSQTGGNVYYYGALLLIQLTFFGIFFFLTKRAKVDYKQGIKLKFSLDYRQIIIIAVCGLVALFSFSSLITLLEEALKLVGYGVGENFSGIDLSNFGMLIINLLIVGILPAICEELIFRGIILNGFRKYNKYVAIALSALLFMIMHMSIEQSIYQFVLGFVLGFVAVETGSIVAPMILHAVNNCVVLFVNYMYVVSGTAVESTKFIFNAGNIILPIVIAIVGCLIIFGLLILIKKLSQNKNKEISKNNDLELINKAIDEKIEMQSNVSQNLEPSQKEKVHILSNKVAIIGTIVFGIMLWVINFVLELLS